MSAPAPATPALRDLQLAIWKLLTAPEGARPGLADLARRGELDEAMLTEWIAGDDRLDAVGRVDVYANMYFFRLHDVLKEDFTRTAALLGHDRFHNLVTDFLLVHPSVHQSLRYLGRPLPAFIAAHAYGKEIPWAADVAALEWARNEAFQARNAPVLTGAALGAVPVERWADLRLAASPSVSLVEASCDLAALWDRLEDEGAPAEPERRTQVLQAWDARVRSQFLLVHRQELAPEHEEVPADEAEALRGVLHGKTFGEVCDGLARTEDDLERAGERAAALLAGWLERELLSGYGLD